MNDFNKKSNPYDHIDTLFAQADGAHDPQTGGVVPPLQLATTFERDENNIPLSPHHLYARDDNDSVRLAESILSKAEQAEEGLLLPSGMAAVASVMRTVANGGRIIMQSGIYWGATKWVRDFCARRSIDLLEVDCSDLNSLEALNVKTPLTADILWIETPSNPYLKTTDIAGCAKIAQRMGASLVVDSTAATPILSQPLQWGADFVMHSATKAINGHSDVLAGFLACANAAHPRWQMMKMDRHDGGSIIGAFEAWLLIRGMRTLPLRMERMCRNTQTIADYLNNHKAVETVLYPGLPHNAGHNLACQQMRGGFGSLLSFQVKGGKEAALKTIGKLNYFKRATSLGGVESLVEHRHTIESSVPDNLLRLSVGIENIDDLLQDLEQSLPVVSS